MSRIVHISPSTLAGAPSMLATAQRVFLGHEAVHLRCGDYARARDAIAAGSVPIAESDVDRAIFVDRVVQADLIHVHNFVPRFALEWLAELGVTARVPIVYQAHSPIGERPIYQDLSSDHGIDWAAKLAVAQAHPRMFPSFRILPNCLFRDGLSEDVRPWEEPNDPVRVVYSPSTDSSNRWARKSSPTFSANLGALRHARWAQVVTASDWPPEKLIALRRIAEFGIDEVVTGGFHLVTYETMACGGVVVNAADSEAVAALQMGARTAEAPPWLITNEQEFVDRMRELAHDSSALAAARRASHAYFWTHLRPSRVVVLYDELYREVGLPDSSQAPDAPDGLAADQLA
ncbi:MAG: hypothetical protein LBD97_08560 [Bifidobacteriaceae bacterium]|jgi:hypothetical protein|nr:hypothetical protein [Bifidobacteriaceae bacterium]